MFSKILNEKKVYLILKIILIGKHFKVNIEALHLLITTIIKFGISEINGKSAVLAWNVTRKVRVEEKQRMNVHLLRSFFCVSRFIVTLIYIYPNKKGIEMV